MHSSPIQILFDEVADIA